MTLYYIEEKMEEEKWNVRKDSRGMYKSVKSTFMAC